VKAAFAVPAVGIAALLLLGSCSLLTRPEATVEGRPTFDRFELSGRIAVRVHDDGYSGSLRWRHVDDRDRLELFAPTGTVFARLSRGPDGATMEMSDGKRYREADAATLSRSVLGWELPLEQLRFWVFARPAPGSAPTRFDIGADGRPVLLEQDGWRISYLAYSTVGADVLPARLDLERTGLRVRLIVTRWSDPGLAAP
jgi:outer membrane lipoprotein LolB